MRYFIETIHKAECWRCDEEIEGRGKKKKDMIGYMVEAGWKVADGRLLCPSCASDEPEVWSAAEDQEATQ